MESFKKPRKHLEDDLQIGCIDILNRTNLTFCHVPNERQCSPQQGIRNKRKGVKPGVPDILIFDDFIFENNTFKGLAVEVKIPPNKLTRYQLEWFEKLSRGWICVEVNTIEYFITILKNYYNIKVIL